MFGADSSRLGRPTWTEFEVDNATVCEAHVVQTDAVGRGHRPLGRVPAGARHRFFAHYGGGMSLLAVLSEREGEPLTICERGPAMRVAIRRIAGSDSGTAALMR